MHTFGPGIRRFLTYKSKQLLEWNFSEKLRQKIQTGNILMNRITYIKWVITTDWNMFPCRMQTLISELDPTSCDYQKISVSFTAGYHN